MVWRTGSPTDIGGFRLSGSSGSGKCPVCGDPGSNCSSGKETNPKILLNGEAPPEKQIIRVEEDVVETVRVGPNEVLTKKASKGDYLTRPEAEALDLL